MSFKTIMMIVVAFVIMFLVIGIVQTLAHEAIPTAAEPNGWSYPMGCCSSYDCREVSSKAIGEKPEGYLIKITGEIIAYGDTRLKDSPDGVYHWCSVAGADDSRTICLYVPPRGY